MKLVCTQIDRIYRDVQHQDTSTAHEKMALINRFDTAEKLIMGIPVEVTHRSTMGRFGVQDTFKTYRTMLHYDDTENIFFLHAKDNSAIPAFANGTVPSPMGGLANKSGTTWELIERHAKSA